MDLIFFGMQGSGKGTLGKSIANRYGMLVFETGEQLRKLSREDSDLAKKVKSIIEAGHLVSNEVVMEIVENFMSNLQNGETPILFDGIPRKTDQARSLNSILARHNRKYSAVILDISEKTALNRLTTRRICKICKTVYPAVYTADKCACGGELITRSDDNPEAIKTRLDAFKNETVPAMEMYSDRLIKIDGEPSIEEVKKLAFAALDGVMKR
ncbi:nucleoside monophosphate kinase [Candidatus Peregrinibacteria bacterium]|nr:nucleoside monophosphate kinase [Candidatus Peregrinibacteria bacterium]